jgi:hypothetical protein
MISTAARASLKDEALQGYIDLSVRPNTFEDLKKLYGGKNGLAGEPLYQKIQDESFKQTQAIMDDIIAQAKIMEACFVAGTLVHTRDGLKPIEEIKVGDCVLSKPESGEGELSYHPVTQTFEHDDKEIYCLELSVLKEQPSGEKKPARDYDCIAVTGAHPIWVKQMHFINPDDSRETRDIHTWMTVEELWQKVWDGRYWRPEEGYWGTPIRVELADGRSAEIFDLYPVLQSGDSNIGVGFNYHEQWHWEPRGATLLFGKGVRSHLIDPSIKLITDLVSPEDADYDYSDYDTESEMSVVNLSEGHLPMRRKVYNLKVADTHTYFVGKLGLWVHNKNWGDRERQHPPLDAHPGQESGGLLL